MAQPLISKDAVRQAAYNKRLAIPVGERKRLAGAFMENFLAHAPLPEKGAVISAYMPFNAELDVRPLMSHLRAEGYRVVVPHVIDNLSGLEFRTWTEDTPVYTNLHGIEEVSLDHSEVLLPDLMLVPFIAFDDKGGRMGYGSGQFDRTFENMKKARHAFFTIGVGYESQREVSVPVDQHDYPLDMVVTDKNVYRCRESRK